MSALDVATWLLLGGGLAIALAFWLLGRRAGTYGVVALLCLAFAIDAAVASDGAYSAVFVLLAVLCGRHALEGGAS